MRRRSTIGARWRSAAWALGAGTLLLAAGCVAYRAPGPGGDKRLVCHKGRTIEVAAAAVDAHLRHGDHLGPCR